MIDREVKNKRIYTHVEFNWNPITKQYEPIREDFYNYSGRMAHLQEETTTEQTVPSVQIPTTAGKTTVPLNVGNLWDGTASEDAVLDTSKVTAGYFTGGAGTLDNADIHTGSLADANEKYYFNITQTHPQSSSAATQFSVAYGHIGGSGSQTDGGNVEGPTEAVYRQWATTLLAESEVSGGFRISINEGSNPTNKSLTTRDSDIYVLGAKRALFKDRLNKKNWTIILSGSDSGGNGTQMLHLTDDSDTTTATSTVAGSRFNIVSGSQGSIVGNGASDKCYGWLYPEVGVMVFSAAELSSSIQGQSGGNDMTASFDKAGSDASFISCSGFSPNLDSAGNANNALRFVNCLQPDGTSVQLRSEEDQVSVSYFCRVKAQQMNFSNNPTFVSGSSNEIRSKAMWGNPTVYITGIGIYGTDGQLVAVGKLSTPLIKNFSNESTIKVKLTY